MCKISKLKEIIEKSNNIVFFTGAGVSTESGIPDFRSQDGLYNLQYQFPTEEILSKNFFMAHPSEFWKFYREKLLIEGVEPNVGHLKIAKLEKEGKVKAVVTQNIDLLHEMAGSKNVFHIHGDIDHYTCPACGKTYTLEDIQKMDVIPTCHCGLDPDIAYGSILNPGITLYGEGLPQEAWDRSLAAISKADTLIIAGTSLSVYPAAGMIDYFSGKSLVIINKTETPRDKYANLVIHDSFGEVMRKI